MAAERLIGMVIFPKLTQLDMTGPYEVLARLPNTKVHLVAHTLEPVTTDRGMQIVPSMTFADCPPLDVVMVPGGPGQQELMEDRRRSSSCSGRRATRNTSPRSAPDRWCWARPACSRAGAPPAHWAAMDHLAPLGAVPVSESVVVDGNVITAAGVASGIDFALAVAAILEGEEVARQIQLHIEYDPAPPFNSGSPKTARRRSWRRCADGSRR